MSGFGQGIIIKDDLAGSSAKVDSKGALKISGDVNASFSASSVALNDGADGNQKATVFNTGAIKISGDVRLAGASTGDGAILDGAVSSVRATVKNFSNSQALAVTLVNSSGDVYNAGGSSSVDPVGLKNIALTVINPATEDTLLARVGIGSMTVSMGISGDVSTIPKAGQVWNVKEQNVLGVQIVGGAVGGKVSLSGDVTGTAFDIRPLIISDKITVGKITAPIGVSGDITVQPSSTQAPSQPLAVRLTDGTNYYNAANTPTSIQRVSGDIVIRDSVDGTLKVTVDATGALKTTASIDTTAPLYIGRNNAPVGVSGDVLVRGSTNQSANQPLIVRLSDGSSYYNASGGGITPVSQYSGFSVLISGDSTSKTIGLLTTPISVSGDVSTIPKAGQTWPISISSTVNVSEQRYTGVQVGGGLIGISGDSTVTTPRVIGSVTAALGISGDVSTKPLAGQVWPVSDNSSSLTVDGTVAISSIPVVTVGSMTTPMGISGDVSTTPKAGQTWPISGSVNALQSGAWSIGSSGDVAIVDGSTRSQKASVYSTGAVRISGDVHFADRTASASYQSVSVTTSATQILAANNGRREWIVVFEANAIGSNLYLGFNNSVTSGDSGNGFPIMPSQMIGDNVYTGALWGISGGGTINTKVMEK